MLISGIFFIIIGLLILGLTIIKTVKMRIQDFQNRYSWESVKDVYWALQENW